MSLLVNEWIGSRFLQIWEVPTPDISLVNISKDHIPTQLCPPLQTAFFNKHCFGSAYLPYAKEIDHFFNTFKGRHNELKKIRNRKDFLKIGLFDIWLSNEDRNHNNFNLLLNPEEEGYTFYAIDHGACFNSACLHRGIYAINEFESLLTSDIIKVLFSKGQRLTDMENTLVEDFYICTNKCWETLPAILDELPESWAVNKERLQESLMKIFSKAWLKQTENLFRQFIQLGIR